MSRLPDATRADVTAVPAAAMSARSFRLVIAGPHPLVRWGLSHAVDNCADLSTAGEATSREEALMVCHMLQPDVVAIDASLPERTAWHLLRDLRISREDVGLVLLAADRSDQSLFRALDAGASAFIGKDAPIVEVLTAIRGAAQTPSSFHAAGLAAALRRRRDQDANAALSPRELQILMLLRDGLSVPDIADRLYVSLSTAKTYVTRLYDKLGARNRAQALMTAVRIGLFDDSPDAIEAAG